MLHALVQDLRFGLRAIRKAPGVTATAIVTLALGIGATTTIFTVINGVLLKPLDYHRPEQLVRITGGATLGRFDLIRNARSFSGTAAFLVVTETAALGGSTAPDALRGARVTSNFLNVLGVAPLLGRSFLPSEESPGPAVAMISFELWRRRFNADPHVVGTTIRLDAAPCTIIGVLPADFSFPFQDIDLWRPLQPATLSPQARQHSPLLGVFGRLRDGATMPQASVEMALIEKQYALANPGMLDARANRPERVTLFQDQLVQNVRPVLWMLFGAVTCVLLIASSNVAALLLARAALRSREFAIRTAVGASRRRLISQLLAESSLLAIIGGISGVVLSAAGVQGIRSLPGLELPRLEAVRLDTSVLLFAIALSVITTLLFGLTPSLRASKLDVASVIKGVSKSDSRRLRVWRSSRGLLVTGQIALSTALVIGAALLLQTLLHLRSVDVGFEPAHLLTMQLSMSRVRYPSSLTQATFFEELVRRVESLPGIKSAAVTLTLPATGWAGTPVYPARRALPKLNERPIAILQAVTPGYFRTLGIPLRQGRDFDARDSVESPPVAIVNERLVRRFWPEYPPGSSPVGQYILAGASPSPLQIIGVVADVRQSGLTEAAQEAIYRPRTQTPPMSAMFAVRTPGDPLQAAETIRREIAAIDPDLAITAVRSMEDVVERSEGQRRYIALLLACFAGIGLALALIGVYGLIAYLVVQRTRELGIRRALGAEPADVLVLVLREGLVFALLGAAIGLAAAGAVNKTLRSLVFGVSTLDVSTYAATTIVVVLLTLAATLIPAVRATRINPAEALRTAE